MSTRVILLGGIYCGSEFVHADTAWPWVSLRPLRVSAPGPWPVLIYVDTRRRDRAFRRIFRPEGTNIR